MACQSWELVRSYRNAAQRVSMSGRTVKEAHFFLAGAGVLMSRRNLTLRESGCLVVEFRGWRSLYHAKYNREQRLGPIERSSRSDSQLDIDSVEPRPRRMGNPAVMINDLNTINLSRKSAVGRTPRRRSQRRKTEKEARKANGPIDEPTPRVALTGWSPPAQCRHPPPPMHCYERADHSSKGVRGRGRAFESSAD